MTSSACLAKLHLPALVLHAQHRCSNLYQGKLTIINEDMARYSCSECKIVSFTRKSSARRHIENKHLGLGNILDFEGFPVHEGRKFKWNSNDDDQDETGKTLVTPADIIYVEELLREWARLDAREMFLKDIYLRNVTTKMVLDLYNNVKSGRTGILRTTEDFIDSFNKAQAAVDLLNTLNKKEPKSSKDEDRNKPK